MIYGGLVVIIAYAGEVFQEDYFLLLDNTPFLLLDGEYLLLL